MLGRPGTHPHQRAEIRLQVEAAALFVLSRGWGHGRVRNLSAGGVEISSPLPKPEVGARAELALMSAGVRIDALEAEVVRETKSGVAFRFTNVDDEKRSEILRALQRM